MIVHIRLSAGDMRHDLDRLLKLKPTEANGRHLRDSMIVDGHDKLLVFLTLIANVFAPWGIATTGEPVALGVGVATYLVKVSGLAVLIGVLESMFAKLRLFRVTDLLGVAFILALLGLVFFYVLRG